STCLFDEIQNMKLFDSLLFFTSNKNLELFCYSLSGEFKFKISSVGKGPFEYTRITDYTINHTEKQIIIYDQGMRKFLSYSIAGVPIGECRSIWFFREIEWTKWGLVGYEASSFNIDGDLKYAPGIIQLDSSFNYSKHLFRLDKKVYPHIKKSLYSFEGEVYFNPYWERCIYKLTKNGLKKVFQYTFGSSNVSDISGLRDGSLKLEEMKSSNTAFFLYDYYRTSNFQLLHHAIGNISMYYMLCKDSSLNYGRIILNDIVGPVMLNPILASENWIMFNDPNNPIPKYSEWVSIYKMFHSKEPGQKLRSQYQSLERHTGSIANNIIVRLSIEKP
ncbi:MAG: 6-bladed beta-propeller, partial [Clostridiales bacterium]|nr:6-bladed beta-propeller [Clostridiales bacterium]